MYKKISYSELIKKLESHNQWLGGLGGRKLCLNNYDLSKALSEFKEEDYLLSFHDSTITNCFIGGCLLQQLDFSCAVLNGTIFKNGRMRQCSFRYASMNYVLFENQEMILCNFTHATLIGAKFVHSPIDGSILLNTKLDDKEAVRKGVILQKAIAGYKVCMAEAVHRGVVVKLQIPKGAVVFSINNGKCRTNIAKVVRIGSGLKDVCSDKDTSFHYKLGKTVEVKDFDLDYSRECSTGIHFFRTMKELQEYRTNLP